MNPGFALAGGGSSASGGAVRGATGLPITGALVGPCADSGAEGRVLRLITQPAASDESSMIWAKARGTG
jgi:hypothetical protein